MPTVFVNTHQAAAWNGYEGRRWAERQDRYDTANDGMSDPLLDAAMITESDRVLDVGCANGRTTRLAARRARRQASGIGLSAPMLERARVRAAEERIANLVFELGDAQVFPFIEGGFDVAISQGGVMSFAHALAPLWAAMREHGPAVEDGPGPTWLTDADLIAEVLAGARFTDITTTAITVPMVFGRDADSLCGLEGAGPVMLRGAVWLVRASAPETVRA